MGLTTKQRQWIEKHKQLSAKEIAEKLHIAESAVEDFFQQSKKPAAVFFYLLMLLIPVLFFGLFEVCLRIVNYGYNSAAWIEMDNGISTLNPQIGRRYFHNIEDLPTSIEDGFQTHKRGNSFRVFVLGGSSAAGYPYMPLGSFSRYIRRRLEILYPEWNIEVVNISLTAVNSFTIRDLLKDVVKKEPDLILIYAGHNEYYGAYGVGSVESIRASRPVINLMIYLNRFKTVIFLRDIIGKSTAFFGDESEMTGTLMSRMVKEREILFHSKPYRRGIEQFSGNMCDITRSIRRKKIPLIIGNLVANLGDQEPFVSTETDDLPAADSMYRMAKNIYQSGNYHKADSLFRYAKDLDALRFRASEEMNAIISRLGNEYGTPIADIDSAFRAASPHGIIGANLMADHLHPTLQGQMLIGQVFFEKMQQLDYLPAGNPGPMTNNIQDSRTRESFFFSELDSVIAEYKIKLLKNDWPYVDHTAKRPIADIIQSRTFIDSVAFDVAIGKIKWEKGQRRLAEYFLRQKRYQDYTKQMNMLISQYPWMIEYYDIVAGEFLKINEYSTAFEYAQKGYRIHPTAFSAKWLGNIYLYWNQPDSAICYLEQSIKFNDSDPQVFYNLAGAYSYQKEYRRALENVAKCLAIDSQYQGAAALKKSLQSMIYE